MLRSGRVQVGHAQIVIEMAGLASALDCRLLGKGNGQSTDSDL